MTAGEFAAALAEQRRMGTPPPGWLASFFEVINLILVILSSIFSSLFGRLNVEKPQRNPNVPPLGEATEKEGEEEEHQEMKAKLAMTGNDSN